MRLIVAMVVTTVFFLFSYAQHKHSTYKGEEKREIKALSMEDIDGYMSGDGMGLAKAAELNGYPGPRHVLELAEELRLSREQKEKTSRLYQKMHDDAIAIGKEIVEKERALNMLFDSQDIDEPQLEKRVAEISQLQGKLRLGHLGAHLEMKRILAAYQITSYVKLRGYD